MGHGSVFRSRVPRLTSSHNAREKEIESMRRRVAGWMVGLVVATGLIVAGCEINIGNDTDNSHNDNSDNSETVTFVYTNSNGTVTTNTYTVPKE